MNSETKNGTSDDRLMKRTGDHTGMSGANTKFEDTGLLNVATAPVPEVVIAEPYVERVVSAICKISEDTIRSSGRFSIALSGGRTPEAIFKELAKCNCSWAQWHVFWGDERNALPDNSESNFRMASESLLSKVSIPQRQIYRYQTELADPQSIAKDYERQITRYFGIEREGTVPQLDLTLLGIGTDGHTASLFPPNDAAADLKQTLLVSQASTDPAHTLPETETHLVQAKWVEKLDSYRYTLSLAMINGSKKIFILATGKEKSALLKEILGSSLSRTPSQHEPPLAIKYPVQFINPQNGSLTWYLDKAAANI